MMTPTPALEGPLARAMRSGRISKINMHDIDASADHYKRLSSIGSKYSQLIVATCSSQ